MEVSIFSPKKSVISAIEHPNLGTVVVLVLIPIILSIIGTILNGFALNPLEIIFMIVRNFFSLLLLSATLYVLFHVIKGSDLAKGKFSSVLSGVSLIYVAIIILTILGIILTPMAFSKPLLGVVKQSQAKTISADTAIQQMDLILSKDPKAVNETMLLVSFVLGAIVAIYGLIILYRCVSELFELKGFRNLAVLIVWLAGFSIIYGLISTVITFL